MSDKAICERSVSRGLALNHQRPVRPTVDLRMNEPPGCPGAFPMQMGKQRSIEVSDGNGKVRKQEH